MVNSGPDALIASMNIEGTWISQFAPVVTLTGEATQRNSLTSPDLVAPVRVPVRCTMHLIIPFLPIPSRYSGLSWTPFISG